MRMLPWVVVVLGCVGDVGGATLPTAVPVPTPQPQPTVPPPTPAPTPLPGMELRVIGYNVESNDASAAYVAERIEAFTGEALWGFAELEGQAWLDLFAVAAADDTSQSFEAILGSTGAGPGGLTNRLGIAFDTERLDLVEVDELHEVNVAGNGRSPLVATFSVIGTDLQFMFMVNHLYRSEPGVRHQEAEALNLWASQQSLPLIAVGDYNFDWDVDDGDVDHDLGYDLMTANDVWTWVRPDVLIRTQCSVQYNSVLDFVFVGNDARAWPATSTILHPQNVHCQDTAERPDHRPVDAVFQLPVAAPTE